MIIEALNVKIMILNQWINNLGWANTYTELKKTLIATSSSYPTARSNS